MPVSSANDKVLNELISPQLYVLYVVIFCETNGELACRLMYIGKLRKKHMSAIQMVLILF